MICFPNAKINLGLNILEKRNDGFHNIESIFYPIGWKDALEALPSETSSLAISGLTVPGGTSDNLIWKALDLLQEFSDTPLCAEVHLHKVIPMGAGLGGGSADGAFALKLFNDLFGLGLTDEKLRELAARLGSDCPFFIANKPVLAYDRGIYFKPVDLNLSGYYLACVNPGIHIGTAEAYGSIIPKRPETPLEEIIHLPVEQWKGNLVNDFEVPMLSKYEILARTKDQLYESGALYCSMTGSGSTFYGIFKEEPDLKNQFKEMTVWKGKM